MWRAPLCAGESPDDGVPRPSSLGEGTAASREPGAVQAGSAALAGSRVDARVVRQVGAGCAWAAASRSRAAAPSGDGSAYRGRPLQAAGAPRHMMPGRLSDNPSATVCRPHPKTVSACRGFPWQSFKVISACNARRVGPVIVEAARRKSAMGDAPSGGSNCSGVFRRPTLCSPEKVGLHIRRGYRSMLTLS